MHDRRGWLVGVLSVVAVGVGSGCADYKPVIKADTRNLFASLTYKEATTQPEKINVELQVYALIQIEAITAFENPRAAAACYRKVSASGLAADGVALAKETPAGWPKIAAGFKVSLANIEECKPVLASDTELFLYSYARVASAVYAHSRATTLSVGGATGRTAIYDAAVKALASVARILEAGSDQRSARPTLAMSGGAANGAFQAGFMFELLGARERALKDVRDRCLSAGTDPKKCTDEVNKADRESKFEALVGTSVGSLIAQLLDLYYVEGEPAPQFKEVLDACVGAEAFADVKDVPVGTGGTCFDGAPPQSPEKVFPGKDLITSITDRPFQRCALMLLYRNFAYDSEQRLMCVERAPVTGLVGALAQARQNFIRFDEMTRNVVDPLLSDLSGPMFANDVVRTVVAVETQQNQTLGLDERTCMQLDSRPTPKVVPGQDREVLPPGGREYCLSSGVMASTVLPFFARPVRHTYSGFKESGGECGTWLDGGLRSGFPAYRALRMSRPKPFDPTWLRVLAIDTGRLDGLPDKRPEIVVDVALNAIGQMASQNGVSEVVMAQQFAARRDRDLKSIRSALSIADPPSQLANPGVEQDDSKVLPVFVPNDAPSALIAEAGYAFDEYVMRGLFTWGRRTAIAHMLGRSPGEDAVPGRQLARRLGWGDAVANDVSKYALEDERTLASWFSAYEKPECKPFHDARYEAGRNRILNDVRDCGQLPAPAPKNGHTGTTPHYFSCQEVKP